MPVTMLQNMFCARQGFTPLLGQSTRVAKAQEDIWFYALLLAAAFLVCGVAAVLVRKWLTSPIESSQGQAVLDLSQLRRMHRDGMLTDQEYEAARSVALAETGVAPSPDKPSATPLNASPAAVVDESDLGPELLDRSNPPDPGPTSDNQDPDGPEPESDKTPEK